MQENFASFVKTYTCADPENFTFSFSRGGGGVCRDPHFRSAHDISSQYFSISHCQVDLYQVYKVYYMLLEVMKNSDNRHIIMLNIGVIGWQHLLVLHTCVHFFMK